MCRWLLLRLGAASAELVAFRIPSDGSTGKLKELAFRLRVRKPPRHRDGAPWLPRGDV